MLNDKQAAFLDHYLQTGNATQSYKMAYGVESDKTARTNSSRLLTNANILAALEGHREEVKENLNITANRVFEGILTIAETAIDDSTKLRAWIELAKLQNMYIGVKDVVNGLTEDQLIFISNHIKKSIDNEK